MMRTVLAVMAGLLCALAGLRHASGLKGEAKRLRRWGQLLAHLSLLLQEGTMSLPDALRQAGTGQEQPDKLLRDVAASIQSAPLTGLSDAFLALCGDVPEKDALCRMFSRLGRGSKGSRVLAVEQCAQEIGLMAQQSAARAEKDAKLWSTLGCTGGICVTLFLL